ncbi:head-tail connector protein [Pseudomonas fluorescens]|uniref:head-tail connector protein n=1 Tax=Pseudomonas fluorescens TaxID=294 RepID=UPI000F45F371|nr:head-tail connector protein [Pseudomonas fluorescens]RON90355.1 hypothetical protein BK668_11675 [Pseudomonas fluorescens]
MSLIDIERAMKHVLAEPEDQDLVQEKLDAAEGAAMRYLNRRVFLDQAAMDLAKAGIPALMQSARAANAAAVEAANAVDDARDRCVLLDYARQALADAHEEIDAIAYGILLKPEFTAACLLTLGHLFANREDVVVGAAATELPMASKHLLTPLRVRMGL